MTSDLFLIPIQDAQGKTQGWISPKRIERISDSGTNMVIEWRDEIKNVVVESYVPRPYHKRVTDSIAIMI